MNNIFLIKEKFKAEVLQVHSGPSTRLVSSQHCDCMARLRRDVPYLRDFLPVH